jgi:hypothetical protein
MGPNVTLRQRAAVEIVSDPHFERLLAALEQATSPAIPARVIELFFVTSDGTVDEVLEELLRAYPQTVSIEVLLEDARWVGALEQARLADELESDLALIRAELDAVRAGMGRWESFLQGREFRASEGTIRMRRAAPRSAARSHKTLRSRPPARRPEHP